MNWLDFTIVANLQFSFFLGMGYFFKNNKDSKDYFFTVAETWDGFP